MINPNDPTALNLSLEEIEELRGMIALLKLVRPEQRGPNCQAVLDHLLEVAPRLLAMAKRAAEAERSRAMRRQRRYARRCR